MNDSFRDSLRVDPDYLGDSCVQETTKDYEDYIREITNNYVTLYNIPEVREYFTQIVTAILLSYNKRFGNRGLQINYRFKSPRSVQSKITEYVEEKFAPDDIQSPPQPMYDGFAMKLITSEVPSILYSRDHYRFFSQDKTLEKLAQERKSNSDFLGKMQEFKSRLVEDEFETPPLYNYNISQEEYFTNCIEVLERTKALVDPSEKNVIAHIKGQITTMEKKLAVSSDFGNSSSPISPRELENSSTSFLTFLDNFERRMHNELSMAVLTRQFTTIFKSYPELFDSLGVSLSSHDIKAPKRKRTENGYESNFIYIDTLFGTIECQLQTFDQYEQGKFGMSAHMLYKSDDYSSSKKTVPRPIPIPSGQDLAHPDVANDFLAKVLYISPRKYSATLDIDRTRDMEFGIYRNYYSIFSEIPPDHPLAPQFQQYFLALRNRENSPLSNYPEKLRQYSFQDLEDYTSSEELERVKEISNLWYSRMDDFADAYNSTISSNDMQQVTVPNIFESAQAKKSFSDIDISDGTR